MSEYHPRTAAQPELVPVDGGRCFTNPVWAVPFDLTVDVTQTEVDAAGNGSIPPGALTVRFDFDLSMTPKAYAVELKALNTAGESTDVSRGPIDVLAPAAGTTGWSDRGTLKDGNVVSPIQGKLNGEQITFTAGKTSYTGRVNGNSMQGTAGGGKWSATRPKS